MNDTLLNVSSSPHIRHRMTTGSVMRDVVFALLPTAMFGVYHFGLNAFLIIVLAVASAVLTELIFDYICKRPQTWKDGSAVVTGLLLSLSLSPSVPLYVPVLGSIFAILFVKCLFGGLGKNFMNPAVAARCFLLISFGSVMNNYAVDGMSSATPLAVLNAGEYVSLTEVFLGQSSGVIGCSALGLLLGGLFLLLAGGITWEIPVSCVAAFTVVMGLFGGHGFDPSYLLIQICGGGVLMGALFMGTDPVTSPITSAGQLIFGSVMGILGALFRTAGSAADSFSYAIVLSNLLVPYLDKLPVPKPLGYGEKKSKPEFPSSAINLAAITLVAGLALSGVYMLTKDTIAQQAEEKKKASFVTVCPDAVTFVSDDALDAAVAALNGQPYDADSFGRTYVNEVYIGTDADDAAAGYVISVTSAEGYDGNITLTVGLAADGTVTGISFTELNETAGMGMLCKEEAFYGQFNNVKTDRFILNKAGGSVEDNEIDSVSGASISSGAVVNAVNTALAFFAANIQ